MKGDWQGSNQTVALAGNLFIPWHPKSVCFVVLAPLPLNNKDKINLGIYVGREEVQKMWPPKKISGPDIKYFICKVV